MTATVTPAPLLLDTHILIWWADGDARLTPEMADAIAVAEAEIYVSVASLWEIVIKRSLGKLVFDVDLTDLLNGAGFSLLPIEVRHLAALERLPPHHRDPFDRILIAQAKCDRLTFLTADRNAGRYEVPLFPSPLPQ